MVVLSIWICTKTGLDGLALYLEACDKAKGGPAPFQEPIYDKLQFIIIDLHSFMVAICLIWIWGRLIGFMFERGINPFKLVSFLKGRRKEPQENIMCLFGLLFVLLYVFKLIAGRYFMLEHPVIQCFVYSLLAVFEANGMFIGYWYDSRSVALPMPVRRKAEQTDRTKRLNSKLKEYIEDGKAYLDPDLSIDKVASALSTNRTYLSEAINASSFGTFRDYVNSLRIEAAKKELLEHPEERLDEIAAKTGFPNGVQLVKKFKEVTGETPKAWRKRQ
jgi:AraC-like DNA-binding protein